MAFHCVIHLMEAQSSRNVSYQTEFDANLFFTLLNSYFGWTEGITTGMCFGAYVAQAVDAENQHSSVLDITKP